MACDGFTAMDPRVLQNHDDMQMSCGAKRNRMVRKWVMTPMTTERRSILVPGSPAPAPLRSLALLIHILSSDGGMVVEVSAVQLLVQGQRPPATCPIPKHAAFS